MKTLTVLAILVLSGCTKERCIVTDIKGVEHHVRDCRVSGSSILCNPQGWFRLRYDEAWSNYISAKCEAL